LDRNIYNIAGNHSNWNEHQYNYWHNALSIPFVPFSSLLLNANPQAPPDISKITIRLSPSKTALLQDESTHIPYKTTVPDVLLAALLMTFTKWTNTSSLYVDLFSEGREKLFPDVHLTRTVGCCVSKYPVVLQVAPSADSKSFLCDILVNVKEAVHTVPNQGIGYGTLRYSPQYSEIKRDSEVSFRFSGKMHSLPERVFSLVQGGTGAPQDIAKTSTSKIDIDAYINKDGTLVLVFAYRKSVVSKSAIARLTEWYNKDLDLLLNHLTQNKKTRLATPSDYSLTRLGQKEINSIFSPARPIESVVDIYAMSQLQQGMLFHSLADTQTGSYTNQLVFDIKGPLVVNNFQCAFAATVHHFPALRTEYAWEGLNEPHCVVKTTAVCSTLFLLCFAVYSIILF
jgi:non-ribosomal peptide synthase protein (TIGR01720 family)